MTKEELFAYIEREYGVTPDYPWLDSPEGAVFRIADPRAERVGWGKTDEVRR